MFIYNVTVHVNCALYPNVTQGAFAQQVPINIASVLRTQVAGHIQKRIAQCTSDYKFSPSHQGHPRKIKSFAQPELCST